MQELPVRSLRVVGTSRLTPHMARITFDGEELGALTARLAGMGPDQQVKLYFPRPGQTAPRLPAGGVDTASWYAAFTAIPERERPWMRSYTLRAYDPERATIDVDFVLHDDAGPATHWAMTARPGHVLAMFGPDGPYARPVPLTTPIEEAEWFLVAGDESALPAIGTLAEALPPGKRATAVIEVAGPADEQPLRSRADLTVQWVHRGPTPPGCGSALVDAVRAARFPDGRPFVWLAGEAGAVRTLRRHLLGDRDLHRRDIEFAGYWRRRRSQDDPPTAEDMADARELLARAQESATAARPGT